MDLRSSKIISLCSVLLLFSCQEVINKQPSRSSWSESEITKRLEKFNCKEEYDFARCYLYASYYKFSCIGSICFANGSRRLVANGDKNLLTTNIRLDISNDSAIKAVGDTLYFTIFAFSDDSANCKCHYATQYSLPAGISIIRKTNHIIELYGYGGITTYPTNKDVINALTNPKMLEYVKKNEHKVNPWFYSELIRRGYLKN